MMEKVDGGYKKFGDLLKNYNKQFADKKMPQW
jgi:hypothetical protein